VEFELFSAFVADKHLSVFVSHYFNAAAWVSHKGGSDFFCVVHGYKYGGKGELVKRIAKFFLFFLPSPIVQKKGLDKAHTSAGEGIL